MARDIPPTMVDKYLKLSHFSMLSNPASWAKNPLSNLIMMGMSRMSNVPEAALQAMLSSNAARRIIPGWSIEDFEKTTTIGNWRKNNPEREKVVKEWWSRYAETQIRRKGMDMSVSILMNQNKRTFKNDTIENIADFPFWMMEMGDVGFLRSSYEDALGRYMTAQGMDTPNEAAHQHAMKRALEDTFRDLSYISKSINFLKRGADMTAELRKQDKIALESNDPVERRSAALAARGLRMKLAFAKAGGQMLMPYVNTPVGVARRAAEYSPLGLGSFGLALIRKDGAGAARALSKMLIGSVFSFGLGELLGAMGLVTGAPPEDSDELKRWKVEGIKPYSLKIGDMYVSLDWAAPMIIPFMMGVSVREEGLFKGIAKGANVFTEMSFIKGLRDTLSDDYPGQTATEKIAKLATNGPMQLIPNLSSKIAYSIDPTIRDTYDPEAAMVVANRAINKLGFNGGLIPKYDAWGEEVKQAQVVEELGVVGRLVNNVLVPWRYSRANTEPETKEVSRLYRAAVDGNDPNAATVLPDFSGTRSLSVGDEGKTTKFTAEEYALWQSTAGQYAKSEISKLMNSPEYNRAPDYSKDGNSKWHMIQDVYTDARERAEAEIAQERGTTFTITASYTKNGKTQKYSKKLSGDAYQSYMNREKSILEAEKRKIRTMPAAKRDEYIKQAESYAQRYAKWELLGKNGNAPKVEYK
jgi:hypothetical protein